MRIDKFLKLSRLIKRRTAAQEMADIGAVRINRRQCKPASEVKEGDLIEIAYPKRILTVTVTNADEKAWRRGAESYTISEEKAAEKDEKPW